MNGQMLLSDLQLLTDGTVVKVCEMGDKSDSSVRKL